MQSYTSNTLVSSSTPQTHAIAPQTHAHQVSWSASIRICLTNGLEPCQNALHRRASQKLATKQKHHAPLLGDTTNG